MIIRIKLDYMIFLLAIYNCIYFISQANDEFVKQMNGYRGVKVNKPTRNFGYIADYRFPTTVDWRNKGIVTGVKNQVGKNLQIITN